ncbi:MAG: hypothetical protein M3O33_07710 [Cyanobacteriota bacterium]|nr:hypothetical protein [Cyanobacteriota bacterium]
MSDYRIDGIMYIDAGKAWAVSHYKKTKLISKIIASTMLFLALFPQGRQIAQEAPLSMFLLRRPCVSTGIGNSTRRREDVSVGKAVYTSRLFMAPGNSSASITCRLKPNEAGVTFQTLRLSFGMRDNDKDSPDVIVNVYKDTEKVGPESKRLSPGQAASIVLDVVDPSNISIETVCTNPSGYCARVYFWEAELEYPRLILK